MTSVAVAAPKDSITRALVARLARDRGASLCHPDLPRTLSHSGALAGFDVVVYRPSLLAREGGPDLAEAAGLLAEVAAARPGKLVLLSSAAIYEPSHQQLGLIAEPRVLPRVKNRISRRFAELELARSVLAESPTALVILRPAATLGANAADSPDPLARLLRGRLALSVFGHDPSIQLLAPEDLAEAVGRAVEDPRAAGVYHVAPAGTVPFRAALRLAGAFRLAMPFHPQRLARAVLSRVGLSGPPEELAWARYPATISGARIARELGFTPGKTSAQALRGTSAPEFDDFGMDRRYIDAYGRTLFHFLHRHYWRIEVRGLEHVPKEGRAVLTGVHRGFMPWDGVMALHTVARGTGRYMRFLIHPCLVKFPYLAAYMTKLGGIVACSENADWVLQRNELLGMFPEGIHGAFTMYKDAYKLGKFGRDEYVRMALRHRAPIIPFVTVGSAETYPILGRVDWKWWKRWSEWPFLPLTPTFPLLPFPLPSKWHTLFLPPFHVEELHPPEAADDPAVVQALSREVRARLETALQDLLSRRRSIFRGAIFDPDPL